MSDFSYTRQQLRHATTLVERNYRNLDPRTHLRRLKRAIQDVQTETGYKYATGAPVGENPLIHSENVGSQTGRVEGRLIARTNWKQFAGDKRQQESSPMLAILLGLLGVIVTLIGFTMRASEQGTVLGIGLLALLGAAVAYYFHEPDVYQTGYYYRKRVRILMEGEVAEHTHDGRNGTDLVASDLTVTFAEDLEIERRDGGDRRRLDRSELPEQIQTKLDAHQDVITTEIDIDAPAPEGKHEQVA